MALTVTACHEYAPTTATLKRTRTASEQRVSGLGDPGGNSSRRAFFQDALVVLLVAWAARVVAILMIPDGSIDAHSWEVVAQQLAAGENPYRTTTFLNWPPLWLQMIFLISKISTILGLPFFHVLQFFLAVVESMVMVALVRLVRQVDPAAPVRSLVVIGLALNPAAILLVCQHGNFDVFIALWIVLFLSSLVRYRQSSDPVDWLYACLFLGLGILTKTIPLILVPLLAGGFRQVTGRVKGLGLMLLLGPVSLGMSILFVLSPADIIAKVLKYRSAPGYFGFSGVFQMAGMEELGHIFNLGFYAVLLLACVGCAVLFWKRRAIGPRETVLLAAMLLMAVPVLGPGYAPQYLYWYLPLLVGTFVFFDRQWRWLLGVCGLVAACTYLVEYALFPSHGMFLLRILANEGVDRSMTFLTWSNISQQWSTPFGQTLIRVPLFCCYLFLLAGGIRRLWSGIKVTGTVPGH